MLSINPTPPPQEGKKEEKGQGLQNVYKNILIKNTNNTNDINN